MTKAKRELTAQEKQCGYRNYAEFYENFDNLLVKRYGENHGLTYTVTDATKGRRVNHILMIDTNNCCKKAVALHDFADENGILEVNVREAFDSYKKWGDFEEAMIF